MPAYLKISDFPQLTLVKTAVGDLANAIIASQTAKQLQSLAQQAAKPIGDIGTMVQQDKALIEDTGFAPSLAEDQKSKVIHIFEIVYADPKANSTDRLSVLSEYTINWKSALVTKGSDIDEAMKKLQSANEAMKNGQEVAAQARLQQAWQLAQQALATQPAKR